MQYLSKNQDDTISIITLVPVGVIRHEDNKEYKLVGLRKNDKNNQTLLYGEIEVVIGDKDYDIADLEIDSIPGYSFIFPEMEKDIIGKWHDDNKSKVVSHRKINKSDIPADRYFRNAWEDKNGKIEENLTKSIEIKKEKLRKERAPLLESLDIEYQKADEKGANKKKQEIAAQKQKLRDITSHAKVVNPKTTQELKALTIDELIK